LGDDEMSFETYIHMEGDEITQLELSIDELVDAALGSIDVDDVAPPTIKHSDAKHHFCLVSYKTTRYILELMKLLISKG
jgi:hypothetical protein